MLDPLFFTDVGLKLGKVGFIVLEHILAHTAIELAHSRDEQAKKKGKPVNHDLEKALQWSFLSALQAIVLNCHKELEETVPRNLLRKRDYSPQQRSDLDWFNEKTKQFAQMRKQVESATPTEESLSLDEIQALLSPTQEVAKDRVAMATANLQAIALKGNDTAPDCYKTKVKTELFQLVCEYFAGEIKHTSNVRHIFDSQSIARIDAKLDEVLTQLRSTRLGTQDLGVKISIHLDTTLDEVISRLDDILTQLQQLTQEDHLQIQSIMIGSVILVVEGSPTSATKLQSLFNTGQFNQILDFTVLTVQMETEMTSQPKPTFQKNQSVTIGDQATGVIAVAGDHNRIEHVQQTQQPALSAENIDIRAEIEILRQKLAQLNASERELARVHGAFDGIERELKYPELDKKAIGFAVKQFLEHVQQINSPLLVELTPTVQKIAVWTGEQSLLNKR